jgi:hypothetical protein
MPIAIQLLAALLSFVLRKLLRTPDPTQKAQQEAFNAKAEEARVMEAGERPESRVDALLLQHDERGD